MNKPIIEISGHLSDETILLLKSGKLSYDDNLRALEHLGQCPVCSDFLAQCFEEQELLAVDPDFSDRIMREAVRAGKEAAAPRPEKPMRVFYSYALRVAAAVCLTLLMLSAGPFQMAVDAIESNDSTIVGEISIAKVDAFTESVWTITDKIVKLEVYKNDQEEK